MVTRFPILHLLLAVLLAFSPSVCLCPPPATGTSTSCCAPAAEPSESACCGSGGDADAERASGCGMGSEIGDAPDGGCDRCEGGCKCKSGPTMKAEAPTTAHVAAPIALPMVFGVVPPMADFATLIRVVRIESKTVPRPVTTLLRQHCALTI